MGYRNNFAPGEWYHCYSRGIDKRVVFQDQRDHRRFVDLLYLMNTERGTTIDDLPSGLRSNLLAVERDEVLVEIGAFALMPNHYHLLLKETQEGGISRFMQKLGTAYVMYFNTRRERSGGLFTRPFRSRHVDNDRYFQHVVDYIHLNPAALYKFALESLSSISPALAKKITEYQHSSLQAFSDRGHRHRKILGTEVFDIYRPRSFSEMVLSARKWEPPGGVASRRFGAPSA